MKRLAVIIPDRLSDIVDKGELQPRYYNPGDVFDAVHIVMTNDDRPPLEPLRYLVGRAELHVHNYSDDLNLVGQPYKRWHLLKWAWRGFGLLRAINPQLIRCHGGDWNVYLAARARQVLGIPYVVSLHINPDVNPTRRFPGGKLSDAQRRHNDFYEYIERVGLRTANLVMPVYKPILPYLDRLGVRRREVCYNVLNSAHLRVKDDYRLHARPRIISVGRLIAEKNPQAIVRAVARTAQVELTIVGDGPERPRLEALARELGAGDRIVFRPALENDALCQILPDYDLFAVHTEYFELNKSVLEALLTGLPVIMNRRHGAPVPELAAAPIVQFVDNTVDGYEAAIKQMLSDGTARESLGRRARQYAEDRWSPSITEAKVAGVYRQMMRRSSQTE